MLRSMSEGPPFRFVPATPGQPTPETRRRTVRSHAASVSRDSQPRRARRAPRPLIPGEGVLEFETEPQQQAQYEPALLYANSLSGNVALPISRLPTYHKPYLPGVMNHYIANLTIPVSELDGESTIPIFRATWIPVVIHDPVIFQVVVLFAASHYATFAQPDRFTDLYRELLLLKQAALSALSQTVQREDIRQHRNGPSDTLIAAAAKMASYEAISGSVDAVSPAEDRLWHC